MIAQILAEGNGSWFVHDTNEIIWGTIAFLIVVGLLGLKAGPGIKKAMIGRTERIQEELDSSARRRAEAEAERDRIREALADSDTEAARIVAEAHTAAAQVTASIQARTETDIVALRERAVTDLESTRRQAVADLTGEVSRLSLGAAEKVVDANLDDATQNDLIEAYIAQVGSSN